MSIDYKRMQEVWPGQIKALDKAMKITDSADRLTAVKKVIVEVTDVWDEIGAWPDDWARFERALTDAQGWPARYANIAEVRGEHREQERQRYEEAKRKANEAFEATYPEHVKMTAIEGKNQIVGEFLDWLNEQPGVSICQWEEFDDGPAAFMPSRKSINEWLAAYFEIDLKALMKEKDAMLAALRRANAEAEAGKALASSIESEFGLKA